MRLELQTVDKHETRQKWYNDWIEANIREVQSRYECKPFEEILMEMIQSLKNKTNKYG